MAVPLLKLSFSEREQIVHILGLYPAFCPDCLCTIGSPECHPLPESIMVGDEPQKQEECPAPGPVTEAEKEEE
jgi:hypothetical protein